MIIIEDVIIGESLIIDKNKTSCDEVEAAILGLYVDPPKDVAKEAIKLARAIWCGNEFDDDVAYGFLGLKVRLVSKGKVFPKPLGSPRYVGYPRRGAKGADTIIIIDDTHTGESLIIDKDEMSYDEIKAAILGLYIYPPEEIVEEAINFAKAIWGGNEFDEEVVHNILGLTVQH